MQFQIRWFDASAAQVREARSEAHDEAEAVRAIESRGDLVLAVKAIRPLMAWPAFSTATAPKIDVAWWCRELRTLLAAGMTVVEALETLHAQAGGVQRQRLQREILNQLHQGKALSAALQHTQAFPLVLVASIKASERTSAMVEALDDYLRYSDMLNRLRKQVVNAAIYPAIVIVLGAGISVFLLLFVMPRFSKMYEGFHGQVSNVTQVLMWVSKTLAQHGAVLGWIAVAVIVALVAAWRSGYIVRWGLRAANVLPWVRDGMRAFQLAKVYQSLAMMFRGGYALDEAMSHCEALGLGSQLSDEVQQARAGLARGQKVSVAFGEAGLTDDTTGRLLAVGERTGNFDHILQTIADRHAETFSVFVERATRLVEPVLLLTVALLVGGLVVAMYMPVFDVAGSIR